MSWPWFGWGVGGEMQIEQGPGEGYGGGEGGARTVFILRGERGACGGAGAGAVWQRGGEWAGRGSDGEVVGEC